MSSFYSASAMYEDLMGLDGEEGNAKKRKRNKKKNKNQGEQRTVDTTEQTDCVFCDACELQISKRLMKQHEESKKHKAKLMEMRIKKNKEIHQQKIAQYSEELKQKRIEEAKRKEEKQKEIERELEIQNEKFRIVGETLFHHVIFLGLFYQILYLLVLIFIFRFFNTFHLF